MLARMFERRRTGYRSIRYREAAAVSHTVIPSDDGGLDGDRTGDPLESHKRQVAIRATGHAITESPDGVPINCSRRL